MTKIAYCTGGLLLFFIAGSVLSLVFRISPVRILEVAGQKEIRFALRLSLATAVTALLIAVITGIPTAWAIANRNIPGKGFINAILDLPMVMPPLVAGLGLLLFLGQSGPFGKLYPHISAVMFSPVGIVIAQVYVGASIFTRNAVTAFMSIDKAYIDIAHISGLSPAQTLLLVEIPLCWRLLLNGAILTFSRAIGEFGATLMLAGATRMKTETLPMAVFLNIAGGDLNAAIVCACILLFFAGILLTGMRLLQDTLFKNQ